MYLKLRRFWEFFGRFLALEKFFTAHTSKFTTNIQNSNLQRLGGKKRQHSGAVSAQPVLFGALIVAANLPKEVTKHGICRTHCPGKEANPSGDQRAPSPAKAYLGSRKDIWKIVMLLFPA
eukprot:g54370.t1